MLQKIQTKRILFGLLAGVLLFTSACAQATPQVVVVEVTRLVPQTVVVTQIVTPEGTTPPPAETPANAETPAEAEMPTPRPTPTSKPIDVYFPIEGCNASRLHLNEKAMVTYDGGNNALRNTSDISQQNVLGYAEPGDVMTIIGGPECSYKWIVWKVRLDKDNTEGWTPEGNGERYFLVPVR